MPSQASNDMPKVDPERAAHLAQNLGRVLSSIRTDGATARPVRLVAVSKLKPAADILALHQSEYQQAHFGENYVQELQQKASILPSTIKWSFIGGLQSNKCSTLAQVPNLWAVNSVDTAKKVDALAKGRRQLLESSGHATTASTSGADNRDDGRLRIFVQVNTSGEESKSGVEPGEAVVELCRHVQAQPSLKLQGVMTIGAIARSQASAETENEDFVVLKRERDRVAEALQLDADALELSMGMSQDYEPAIRMGSSEVRVGSTIFGERPPKSEATI